MIYIELTQKLVKEVFNYDNGVLYYKIKPAIRVNIGDVAGFFSTINNRWSVRIQGKIFPRSRIVFLWHNGYLPDIVDHININEIDDRIENLRGANKGQNCRNSNSRKGSTSKYLGVSKSRPNKWQVDLSHNYKRYRGGIFNNEVDAALAYNKLAVKHHGEFANLNIVIPD